MRPVLFRTSEKDEKSQTAKAEERGTPLDRVFAIMRRMSERLTHLETQVGNLRRDLNRVDRKVYRAEEPPASLPQPKTHPEAHGIWEIPWPD